MSYLTFLRFDCGVRQGENLFPLLFSLLLNDLEEFSNYVGNTGLDFNSVDINIETYLRILILIYADDIVLISDYLVKLQSSL